MPPRESPLAREKTLLPATRELMERIGWFVGLRWVAILGVVAFVEAGRRILPVDFHPVPVYLTVGLLALYNLLATVYHRHLLETAHGHHLALGRSPRGIGLARWLLPRTLRGLGYDPAVVRAVFFVNAQMMADLAFLAVLIHFTGGIENPLRMFFLFHVIIAAILLSRRATYVYATVCLLLMAAVALGELQGWLPHYPLNAHWKGEGYLDFHLVGTQLFLLGTTLFITAYMASSIAAHLREKELDVVLLTRALEEEAERLQGALAQVRAAERAKSQYMRKVAHELRGPLGTVHTALTVALQHMPEDQDRTALDLVQRAERRSLELANMTRELLSLSRARDTGASADWPLVDPREVARRVLDEQASAAREAGLVLTVELAPDLPKLRADEEGLADLLSNLLGNAIRYTPPGGSVVLAIYPRGDALRVEVADTGIGIEEKAVGRVFEDFFRSDAARAHVADGSGLGLAIVKAVVDQHGGFIRVESVPGLGTRFLVKLPLSPTNPDGAAVHPSGKEE